MTEPTKNEELLNKIRDDYTFVKDYWRENYEEGAKCMDFVACVPPTDFTADRKNRPCIWPDELSQYIKQSNNNLRQNKRSIKVSPRNEEATDKDAEHRQAYIRGIEYASKAESVYTTGYEAAVESGFGFWRVTTKVVGAKGEQEPRLVRIPNQFTVYLDPEAKEADRSDGSIAFVTDTMRQTTFAKRYPKADKKSFAGADAEVAPGWLHGDNITVAEYWTREEHEDAKGEKTYTVKQYITNGFEILEEHDWIGSWIPIIGCFGEEIYVKNGGDSKLRVISLIWRALACQQMLSYIASQEAEEFGMAPRAPFIALEGTVDPERWKNAHKVPTAYLLYKRPPSWDAAWGPPPVPARPQFQPNIQQYELARDGWRRSIQAAMGITPLPTAAQRQNEKSGIALEKIQDQEAIGSFHFTDNFVRALGNTGRQLNELITKLAELDSLPAQVLGQDQKGEDMLLNVTKTEPAESEALPEANYFFAHRGQFEVSISDGPNYDSERDEQSQFADTLLENLPQLGTPPQITQKIASIAIKMKNIGTFGDELADLLSPPDPNNIPPQAQAAIAQAQGQVQQLTAELQQLRLEKMGKVIEIQGKQELAKSEYVTRMSEADKDRETKIAVAEITTKAQNINERMGALEVLMQQFHQQAHELGMAVQQHAQNMQLAQQSAQAQSQQSAQDASQQAALQPPQESGAA